MMECRCVKCGRLIVIVNGQPQHEEGCEPLEASSSRSRRASSLNELDASTSWTKLGSSFIPFRSLAARSL